MHELNFDTDQSLNKASKEIQSKGESVVKDPKARSTPLQFSVFDRYQRLWKQANDMLRASN